VADQSFQEKTEQATPKRRRELRKEGKIARSMEIPTAAVLLLGSVALYMLGHQFVQQIGDVMKDFLTLSYGMEVTQSNLSTLVSTIALRFAFISGPIIITIMVVGLTANVAQTGLVFSAKAFKPSGSFLNPLDGLKKVGPSQKTVIELSKSFLKIMLVGLIGYVALSGLIANSVQLVDSTPAAILTYMGRSAFSVAVKISAAFMVFAAVDYYVQRRKFEHEIKMTKEEIKEEQKQEEGNPQIKGRIRREMVKHHRMRMMQSVPKADVVVTNPTHFAVAIMYDSKAMSAPKVVAKGKDLIAQKIKEIAKEHNIPIVEDKPLAQLLFKTVDIDEQIPPDLFKAVAQILAYIYQM